MENIAEKAENLVSNKEQQGVRMLATKVLTVNPNNPRKRWDESKDESGHTPLERLAENIKANGLLSPVVVTPRC